MKEVTFREDDSELETTMWNDVATKSPTKIGKRVWIVNSVARYDTYKRRIVLNVNELETIELNTCFVLCTH